MAARERRNRNDQIYTREEIEDLIAQGRSIFILDGIVVKADAWRPFHPGGDMAILHMLGRDATDEIYA
jgi:delta8-fatty-acid desaturase